MVAYSKILLVASAAAVVSAAPAVSKPKNLTGSELTPDSEATNVPAVADETESATSKSTDESNDMNDFDMYQFDMWKHPNPFTWPDLYQLLPSWMQHVFRRSDPEPGVTTVPELTPDATVPAVADKSEAATPEPTDDYVSWRDCFDWIQHEPNDWPLSVSRRSTPQRKVTTTKTNNAAEQESTKPGRKAIIDGIKYSKIYTDGSQPNEERTWGDVPQATGDEKKKHGKRHHHFHAHHQAHHARKAHKPHHVEEILRRDVGEEKDIHYVLDDIKAIDSSTKTLTNDLTSYEGGFWASLPLINDLNNIYSYVYTSSEHSSVLPGTISAGDCDFFIDLMRRTLDVDMKAAMSALTEKRDLFAKKGMDSHVVSGLELLQAGFGKLGAQMTAKAVEEKKEGIKEVMELIDRELRDTLKGFERKDEEEDQ